MVDSTHNRLQWRCQRGMLELDIILLNFLDKGYQHLSETDKHLFEKLLEYSNHELVQWLIGRVEAPPTAMLGLIDSIRNAYGKR